MSNPLIQIGDEIREMTDEEYAVYLQQISTPPAGPEATDETPSPD
jgi:hypothetical protein